MKILELEKLTGFTNLKHWTIFYGSLEVRNSTEIFKGSFDFV